MATKDVGRHLYVPGRLAVGVTDLTIAFPHGGTDLGSVQSIELEVTREAETLRTMEFGTEVVEVVDLGQTYTIAAALRGWDEDALNIVFPSTTELAATSGRRFVSFPGASRAGALLSASSVVLAFSPDDPETYPGVLFHRAIPLTEESATLSLALRTEGTIGVVFRAIRSVGGRAASVGLLADLDEVL